MNLSPDSSRVAVYHNEVHYLSKYLKDRYLDLSNHLYWFFKWGKSEEIMERAGVNQQELEELQEEGDDRLYELCDQVLKVMSPEEKEEFVTHIAHEDVTEAPAWSHMDLRVPRLPRNTWLVHFTNEAYQVSEQGFKFGASDMDQVAYTTYLHSNSKKYGGYNFAFVAGNRESVKAASQKSYGKHAVMFQASGLEVYHYGDQEHQVIFWGAAIDPKTIIELSSDRGEWSVAPRQKSSMYQKDRAYVYSGSFEEVVNWVEDHWFQYRRQIMGK